MKPRWKAVRISFICRPGRGTHRKHLIGLVEDELLHGVGLQEAALDHIVDTTRSTDDDLRAVLEGLHVIADAGAANAGVALDVHEVTNGDDDLLDLLSKLTGGSEDESLAGLDAGVDLLQNRDGEGGGLASAGLSLGDDIVAWDGVSGRDDHAARFVLVLDLPLTTGRMARDWMAEGRSAKKKKARLADNDNVGGRSSHIPKP